MPSRIPRQSSPPATGRNRTRRAVSRRQRSPQGRRQGEPPEPQPPAVPFLPVSLAGYPFSEISTHWETLPHGAGIFALLHRPADPGQPYQPLFLDEADDIHEALTRLHTRALLSTAEERGTVVYAVLYTELVAAARCQIVAELRTDFHLSTALPLISRPPVPRRTFRVRSHRSRE
jgi:hypothetical protein